MKDLSNTVHQREFGSYGVSINISDKVGFTSHFVFLLDERPFTMGYIGIVSDKTESKYFGLKLMKQLIVKQPGDFNYDINKALDWIIDMAETDLRKAFEEAFGLGSDGQ